MLVMFFVLSYCLTWEVDVWIQIRSKLSFKNLMIWSLNPPNRIEHQAWYTQLLLTVSIFNFNYEWMNTVGIPSSWICGRIFTGHSFAYSQCTSDFVLLVHPIVRYDIEVLDVWNMYFIVPMKYAFFLRLSQFQ